MTTEKIYDLLLEVPDPEIPALSVLDLGIVRDVEIQGAEKVLVTITPTYTGCPAMDMIAVNIKAVLQEHGFETEIKTVLSPAWTTDWITESGKQKLKENGIVPPVAKSFDKKALMDEYDNVPCPFCESDNTALISQFGTTACKALYKCNDCKEPFDYFKCH